MQESHAVAHEIGFLQIMGYVDRRYGLCLQDTSKFGHQIPAQPLIHGRQRFIQQQEIGCRSQAARQGNPLAFPTAQSTNRPFLVPGQVHQFQHLVYATAPLTGRPFQHAQAVLHIAPYGQVREQHMVLKNVPDAAGMNRNAILIPASQSHAAGFGLHQTRQDVQDRGLAAAAGTQ